MDGTLSAFIYLYEIPLFPLLMRIRPRRANMSLPWRILWVTANGFRVYKIPIDIFLATGHRRVTAADGVINGLHNALAATMRLFLCFLDQRATYSWAYTAS